MTELAELGDALQLADGSYVLPNGKVVKPMAQQQAVVVVPKHSEAVELVTKTRRQLADLPAVPDTMNVVNVVLMYTLYGLDDEQIAIATSLTEKQVAKIRSHDAYKAASALAREAILNVESTDVKEILASGARSAARRVVQDISAEGGAGFAAATTVLDRTGHGARNNDLGDLLKSGGLMIEIIKKDNSGGDVSIKLKAGD